nr:hypothetical protein [Tanacetum cinerariifolium]
NAELNVGRFSRIMLGIIGGGIGASPEVVIVAMVEGVIIGVGGLDSCSSSSSLSFSLSSGVLGIGSKLPSSSSLVSSSSSL